MARPDYYDLVPFQYSNSDDDEVEFGNSDLEATESSNFDIMAEKYVGNTGIVSAGLFYKSIDNWIYTYSTDGYTYNNDNDYEFTQKEMVKAPAYLDLKLQYKNNF